MPSDRTRPGPAGYGADRVNEVVQATTQTTPRSYWSTRMAKAQGLSKATVQRIWFTGYSPTGLKRFRLPRTVAPRTDVVGLYLNPDSRPWSCAWMRRAKSRPFSEPGLYEERALRNHVPTTTSGIRRPSMSWTGG